LSGGADHLFRDPPLPGEGLKLVHQPLGVHAARRMLAGIELAGAIGHKHRAIDEALGREVAPQCALGGDADGIVLHGQG
jgi:hypothetical protein